MTPTSATPSSAPAATPADLGRTAPQAAPAPRNGPLSMSGPSGAVSTLNPSDTFAHRHIGPDDAEIAQMLELLGLRSLDELSDSTVPGNIRLHRPLHIETGRDGAPRGEQELLEQLRSLADQNEVYRSCIGMGYSDCITPPVIQRNILENPGWYTQYTPYQAEISQGRLEALLNFQTLVADLTGLPLAGASLLDEATAAGEAMSMCMGMGTGGERAFFAAADCHPQTLGVLRTRAKYLGIRLEIDDPRTVDFGAKGFAGVLLQYPTTDGRIEDYRQQITRVKEAGGAVVMAADLLALTLLTPPGELGADIAIGSAQRLGVPMGFGGPHAGYIATRTEHARRMPGRIIGVSRDAEGATALRMAIQTREQHIRRDKATSNICTAQALLAIMAGMYAVYHGPDGLRAIAMRVRTYAHALACGLRKMGHRVQESAYFDTLRVAPSSGRAKAVLDAARSRRINLRDFGDGTIGVALDETTSRADLALLFEAFNLDGAHNAPAFTPAELLAQEPLPTFGALARTSAFLTHPVFNTHHSETEMLRYIHTLQGRDLSLAHSMIPLGSCTMKLNATSEMLPVTWMEFGRMHPFAPAEQTRGYARLFADLETWLAEITGFAAVSLQPNSGAQGEYTGLLTIRAYHESRGQNGRIDCLIPTSAHGTNPASAVVAGFQVVPVACDADGNIDVEDLRRKAAERKDTLAAFMVTYPSTHGVFEESIKEICTIVHEHGGLVYMDGANMNAQVGLCRPGDIGADVCHLNLHKTFCIPHGGGGPGMGPIGVSAALAPFLPSHPVTPPASAGEQAIGPVSAAPYGSASILPISWVYIALMGSAGLKKATQVAILNANYMAKRLEAHFPVLYTGRNGRCAHEFILDCRAFEATAGIKIDDIAKRLMDYGFHAPTMSWPVPGTLMVEPTESESKGELDRFCEAMIGIRGEISAIEQGQASREDNVLKGAPHTISAVSADAWKHAYSREQAAFPSGAPWLRRHKFWPSVGRIDNPFGDRNLVCTCPSMDEYGT